MSTAVLACALPAAAVTNGEPDGNRHPSVGALVAEFQERKFLVCSGTLIAPRVFLTAGHCTAFLESVGIRDVWVTFDPVFTRESSELIPGTYHTDPAFTLTAADLHDLAVVVLDHPVANVAPADLPAAGLLDQLAARGGLRGQEFVNVGYGVCGRMTGGGPPVLCRDNVRRVSRSPFMALTPVWLNLLMNNAATGEGGVCLGDSGGPHFLGDSNVLVATSSLADTVCRAYNANYRLDTRSARDFLGDFVPLP